MRPTRILSEPQIIKTKVGRVCMLVTDIGEFPLAQVAEMVSISPAKLHQRLFANVRTKWDSENIFDEIITKVRNLPEYIGLSDAQEDDEVFERRDPNEMKTGSWEKIDRFVSRFSLAQTKRDLEGIDQDYNSALRLNRMMAR